MRRIDKLQGRAESRGERRLLLEQERIYHWLHGWLLLHIPLSAALLVLGLAHVFMSLFLLSQDSPQGTSEAAREKTRERS